MIHLKTVFHERYKGFLECKRLTSALPRLQYLHHVSADHFAFFQKRRNFSIILLYTRGGKAFLQCNGLFRSFPICTLWQEKKLLQEVFGLSERESISPSWFVSTNYIQYLYERLQLILLIDNTICHKTSAHTVCGSVYAIECEEKIFEKYQQYSLGLHTKQHDSSWMFIQIDTTILQNKFVHAQKDLLQRLYTAFFPQVVLHNQT